MCHIGAYTAGVTAVVLHLVTFVDLLCHIGAHTAGVTAVVLHLVTFVDLLCHIGAHTAWCDGCSVAPCDIC